MNFLEEHKAFIITTLLMMIFVLVLFQAKLSVKISRQKQALYELEMEDPEILEKLLQELAEEQQDMQTIETHRAFNEAEVSKTGGQRSDIATRRSFDEQLLNDLREERELLYAMNSQGENASEAASTSSGITTSKEKKITPNKTTPVVEKKTTEEESNLHKRSTNFYNLQNRKAVHFPNPVYTCQSSGKIVINIQVHSGGKVVQAEYNKSASTSSNGCLIDQALEYAYMATFNVENNKPLQLGTITYVFPG